MFSARSLDDRAKRAWRVTLLLLAALAVLTSPSVASAASIGYSIPQLGAMSDRVVVARVASLSSRETPPLRGAVRGGIVTDVGLTIERALKGTPGASLRISVPGGVSGGMRLVVSESPEFDTGERCILFLDTRGRVVGGRQGRLLLDGSSVPALGMSVDQVAALVSGAAPPPAVPLASAQAYLSAAAPSISSVSPSRQSAGTNSAVTITGGGFGAARGTVTFFSYGGGPRLPAAITSWSDTRIVAVVPAGASSGSVEVTGASGKASVEYAVGFAYSGQRWPAPSMTYRVYPVCADLTQSATLGGVQAGAQAWEPASPFRFVYGGTLGAPGDAVFGNDLNDVSWSNDGLSGILAYMQSSYIVTGSGDVLVESDLVFNDAYRWFIGSDSAGFDVATIAAHEFGHSLALDDQYGAADDGKIMYGASSRGEVHTTLSADDAAGARYIYGDPLAPAAPPALVPVHRFYNLRTGTHFYTASEAERQNVIATLGSVYRFEGPSYRAYSAPATDTVPLYRFYNARTGAHFYTANESEKRTVMATLGSEYRFEGVAYHISGVPTLSAVYRFYNVRQGVHFYTASPAERDSVIANLGSLYRYEGIGFYAP
jgi:hypothetical protein